MIFSKETSWITYQTYESPQSRQALLANLQNRGVVGLLVVDQSTQYLEASGWDTLVIHDQQNTHRFVMILVHLIRSFSVEWIVLDLDILGLCEYEDILRWIASCYHTSLLFLSSHPARPIP